MKAKKTTGHNWIVEQIVTLLCNSISVILFYEQRLVQNKGEAGHKFLRSILLLKCGRAASVVEVDSTITDKLALFLLCPPALLVFKHLLYKSHFEMCQKCLYPKMLVSLWSDTENTTKGQWVQLEFASRPFHWLLIMNIHQLPLLASLQLSAKLR